MRRNSRVRNKNNILNNQKKFTKILVIIVLVLIFIFGLVIIYNFFKNQSKYEDVMENIEEVSQKTDDVSQSKAEEELKPSTFTLTAIGDIMCHNTQYKDAYDSSTGEYDFSYVFEDISDYIASSDISIGNLETCFAGEERGYSNYPTFNSPDALIYDLGEIGIDILTTAGNHALDMGFSGLSRTLDVLDDAGISHTGTSVSQEEQDQILINDVNGIKVAILSYTYGTNGIAIPSDKPYCVNLIDKDLIKKHIDSAKAQNVDVIIACMHWGVEYQTIQNEEQEDLANFLFQNGVDIILGNHPHVLQPMELRTVTLEDGTVKNCFVIYALGNFICDQNAENTRNSIILNLDVTKNTDGTISIGNINYIPIYMYKNSNAKSKKMKVLDIEKTIENYENGTDTSISKTTYNTLTTQLQKIKNILEK